MDHRIGAYFLNAGLGYGGPASPRIFKHSCISQAIMEKASHSRTGRSCESNSNPASSAHLGTGNRYGKTVAVLVLSFKPETDDLREAPSLKLISLLAEKDTVIRVHDPVAMLPSALRSTRIQHSIR
ncbi:UDP binding domain-containing protein [Paenibacillus filicis]|uniref:UDP binding domain-containing protein n=1 Tax=Paenibacillus filicis TaxID=669464 RepID=A0ABU9DRL2_9BACL